MKPESARAFSSLTDVHNRVCARKERRGVESYDTRGRRHGRGIDDTRTHRGRDLEHDPTWIRELGRPSEASDVGAHELARLCAEAERIKPYEITATLAKDKLLIVKSALEQAQTSLEKYQAVKLRTELA